MDFNEYLEKNYNKEFVDSYINSLNKERTHCLILNKNKFNLSHLFNINILKKHEFIDYAYYFNSSLGNDFRFKNGVFYIQDASAMMPVEFLDIKENDIILDMCAAPGGKSIDAAIKLNNTGMILSNENSYERAKILSSNIERMGFCNVFVVNNDFTKEYSCLYNKFNKIILDAPCSGSFMFRKNELSKLDWSIEKVEACAKKQKILLDLASKYLKPGGLISYSTCSISKEENEDIILDFLNTHKDFHIKKIKDNKLFYKSKIEGAIYLMPSFFDGEGQFICILEKENDNNFINIKSKFTAKPQYNSQIGKKYCNFDNYILKNDLIYGFYLPFDISSLNVLRYGLHISTLKGKIEIPSFQLAHYLNNNIIELNDDDFKKYIKGYELNLDNINKDDFYIVSYKNIPLGYVKSKNNKQKNYYPKGLREN